MNKGLLIRTYQQTISFSKVVALIVGPQREKTCLWGGGGGLRTTQVQTSAFVIRVLESTISKLATSEISFF